MGMRHRMLPHPIKEFVDAVDLKALVNAQRSLSGGSGLLHVGSGLLPHMGSALRGANKRSIRRSALPTVALNLAHLCAQCSSALALLGNPIRAVAESAVSYHEIPYVTEASADVAHVDFDRLDGMRRAVRSLRCEEACILSHVGSRVEDGTRGHPAVHCQQRVHQRSELWLVLPIDGT